MIQIFKNEDCCGCNACGDICPTDAITFPSDKEGFWYPKVDLDKCIDCHLCEKVCPMLHKHVRDEVYDEPKVIGAYNKDESIRLDSTSGGVHTALAKKIFAEAGYVGGAIYNADHTVSQIVTDDSNQLPNIRSSKYLQSNAEGVFKAIKVLLNKGEKVFFCGTPCQVQGLYNFLGKRKYENLVVADFVCLGVNSPKVFLKYMDMMEEKYHSHATKIKFKHKKWGWHNFSIRIDFENGKEYVKDWSHDPYFAGYCADHLYTRPSCYECPFRDYPHVSDFTLADFWGIENLDPSMDQDKGTSLILVNTDKGRDFLSQIKDDVISKEYQFSDLRKVYGAMFNNSPQPQGNREAFFEDLNRYPFRKVAKLHITRPSSCKQLREKAKGLLKRVLRK